MPRFSSLRQTLNRETKAWLELFRQPLKQIVLETCELVTITVSNV